MGCPVNSPCLICESVMYDDNILTITDCHNTSIQHSELHQSNVTDMLELEYYTKYYYCNFSQHKKRVINITLCFVTLMLLLALVAVMKIQTDSRSSGGRFAIFKDLSSNGRIYMKNESFTEGLVVLEMDGSFYDLLFDYVDLTNMTINLKPISKIYKVNTSTIRFGDQSLVHMSSSGISPRSNYPVPGIYLKSYGYGFGLVLVKYKGPKNLVAEKLTGSLFVPSGEETFKINMETQVVEVHHASKWFNNPHWTLEYNMVELEKYFMKMKHNHNVFDDTIYYHISQFRPVFV